MSTAPCIMSGGRPRARPGVAEGRGRGRRACAPRSFASYGSIVDGASSGGDFNRAEISLTKHWEVPIGTWDARPRAWGAGAWTYSTPTAPRHTSFIWGTERGKTTRPSWVHRSPLGRLGMVHAGSVATVSRPPRRTSTLRMMSPLGRTAASTSRISPAQDPPGGPGRDHHHRRGRRHRWVQRRRRPGHRGPTQ